MAIAKEISVWDLVEEFPWLEDALEEAYCEDVFGLFLDFVLPALVEGFWHEVSCFKGIECFRKEEGREDEIHLNAFLYAAQYLGATGSPAEVSISKGQAKVLQRKGISAAGFLNALHYRRELYSVVGVALSEESCGIGVPGDLEKVRRILCRVFLAQPKAHVFPHCRWGGRNSCSNFAVYNYYGGTLIHDEVHEPWYFDGLFPVPSLLGVVCRGSVVLALRPSVEQLGEMGLDFEAACEKPTFGEGPCYYSPQCDAVVVEGDVDLHPGYPSLCLPTRSDKRVLYKLAYFLAEELLDKRELRGKAVLRRGSPSRLWDVLPEDLQLKILELRSRIREMSFTRLGDGTELGAALGMRSSSHRSSYLYELAKYFEGQWKRLPAPPSSVRELTAEMIEAPALP